MRLALALTLLLAGPAAAASKQTIGIVTWVAEPRYLTAKDALLAELKKEGFTDSEYRVLFENAQGKKDRLEQILEKFQAEGVSVYVALGTSAAVPMAKKITDKPVVFGYVFNPIEVGIVRDWASSQNNVTGASSYVSVADFLKRLIKRSQGSVAIAKLGVIYTPGEKNTELQVDAVRTTGRELGLPVNVIAVRDAKDVAVATKNLSGKADLLFLTGSGVVGANLERIVKASTAQGVMTATHLEDIWQRGALYGLVQDADVIGRLTGKALAKVLRGAKPASVPIEFPNPRLVINDKTAEQGHFLIAPAVREWSKGG